MHMFRSKKKPEKCPQCGQWPMADILYGELAMNARLERDLEAGRIVLGVCVVTENDGPWQCVDRRAQIYREWELKS